MDDANILQSFFFTQINRNPDQEAVYDFESGAHYTYRDLGAVSYTHLDVYKRQV